MTDEMRNRGRVIADGTERTGGRRDQVLAASGITEALPQVADELLNQYVVTYGRPDTLIPPEKLQVTVSRPGRDGPGAHKDGGALMRRRFVTLGDA